MISAHEDLRYALDERTGAQEELAAAEQRLIHCAIRLGKALRECRIQKGRSLRACAEQIGISAPYLSDVELGRRTISKERLKLLMGVIVPGWEKTP
jgi:hypothetical protein